MLANVWWQFHNVEPPKAADTDGVVLKPSRDSGNMPAAIVIKLMPSVDSHPWNAPCSHQCLIGGARADVDMAPTPAMSMPGAGSAGDTGGDNSLSALAMLLDNRLPPSGTRQAVVPSGSEPGMMMDQNYVAVALFQQALMQQQMMQQ